MDARLICVIGGGIAGLAFAAMHRRRGGEVLALEKNMPDGDSDDGKSVVVNASSLKLLSELNALDNDSATPQNDEEGLHPARLSRARVSFEGAPGGLELTGGFLGGGVCHRAVRRRLAKNLGDSFCAPAEVSAISPQNNGVTIDYKLGKKSRRVVAAAAVIACEMPRLPPPFAARSLDYRQGMISLAAAAENFPRGYAEECFSGRGIVALTPRADSQKPAGIVICAEAAAAGEMSAMSDDELMATLNNIFGGRYGLHSPSPRHVYSPRARRVTPLANGRVCCLGAGAATLHPVGAQGLTMGLSDAKCLSSLLAEAGLTADETAAAKSDNKKKTIESALQKYARRRAPAHCGLLAATSMLSLGGHLRRRPFRLIAAAGAAALSPFPGFRLVSE